MSVDVDLAEHLEALDAHVRNEFSAMPEVVDAGDDLDLSKIPIEARRWVRIEDVVAVVADLKGSTKLGTGTQREASTASIYEAATRPLVNTLATFSADDIAIQGDGAFGVFWGDMRYERAICSGITIKTFSEKSLEARLLKKWPDLETGFKVGIASSRVLVKRVGLPRTDHHEEVWAGKAVNYASKAAQDADRRELIVTGSVWDQVGENDFVAYSCGCHDGPRDSLWHDVTIGRLPEDDPEREGRKLTSNWCENCGPDFCEAILNGVTTRSEVDDLRKESQATLMKNVIRSKAKKERENRRNIRIARTGR